MKEARILAVNASDLASPMRMTAAVQARMH